MQKESREYGYLMCKVSLASLQVQCKISEIQNTASDRKVLQGARLPPCQVHGTSQRLSLVEETKLYRGNTELTLGLSKFSSCIRQTCKKTRGLMILETTSLSSLEWLKINRKYYIAFLKII